MAKLNDPRIIRYNAQRKADKEAEKKAKSDRKMEIKMAAEKVLREEKEKQDREEAERQNRLKDEANNLKKQKDVIKNRQKAEKRKLRKFAETFNYFGEILSKTAKSAKSVDMCRAEMINIVDMLCLKMPLDDMGTLNDRLEQCAEVDMVTAILEAEQRVSGKANDAGKSHLANKQASGTSNGDATGGSQNRCGDREWTFELTQFLIKAINSHPAGTTHRWHAIADYMNMHHAGLGVKEKQVIQRAKLLKTDGEDR